MKNFRNLVDTYVLNREKHKKHLAVVLSLSMLVTFAVPLSLMQPAESMTANKGFMGMPLARAQASDGVEIVTDETEKVKLLVGANKPEITGQTVEQTLNLARQHYLLGIASQFGVFLEGDFIAHNADVESRLAVGGGANLSDSPLLHNQTYPDGSGNDQKQKGYEIANGDFVDKIALQKLLNNWDYADAIVQGGPFRNIVTQTHDDYELLDGSKGKLSKTFVIGSDVDLDDYERDEFGNYTWEYNRYDSQYFRKTEEPLIDFAKEFQNLRSVSQKLATQKTDGAELIFSKGNKTIIYDKYKDNICNSSELNSAEYWNGNIAHFQYTGDPDTNVVKFNITHEEWEVIANKCAIVSYENIPDNANIIVSIAGTEINLTPEYKFTYINGTQITIGDSQSLDGSTNINPKNNHQYCEKLLYNFNEATKVTVYRNFSGNILAPNADVGNDKKINEGHLSGALIAKSFEGVIEVGYRPYQGSIDLLGSTSGYTIPVDKFETDGTTRLPGADFKLTITDEDDNVVTSWTSGDDTEYVNIPTMIDFTGGETYTEGDEFTRSYTVKEESSPEGYVKTDKEYTITVSETVNGIMTADDKTIPTNVTVQLTFAATDDSTAPSDISFTIQDIYKDDAQIRREIIFNDAEYWLEIENQKVTKIVRPTGGTITSEYPEDGTTYYRESIQYTETKIHSSTETETSMITSAISNDESTSVTEIVTNVPKTEVQTEMVVVTDEQNNPVYGNDGSTVTEPKVISSSAVTGTSIEYGEPIVSYYEEAKNTTYTKTTEIPETETVPEVPQPPTKGTVTIESKPFYFDPDSLMLMPMPSENLIFKNDYGFVFKKVDEGNNPITGATIVLEKKSGDTYKEEKQITASSITLDPKILDANTLYRFRESVVPNGYEEAIPTYLVKIGETILHIESETEPAMPTSQSHDGWEEFAINAKDDDRVISMTDRKIYGVKLVLNKADADNMDTLLNGAYFKLYASNGTLVYPTKNLYADDESTANVDESQLEGFLINQTLDLFEELKDAAEDTYDSKYVEDGYLKKGTYYLEEEKQPEGYERASTPFRFKINYANGEYSMEILSNSGEPEAEYVVAFEGSLTGPYKQYDEKKSYSEITAIEAIFKLDGTDTSKILENDALKIQGGDGWLSGIGAWDNLFKNTSLGSYELTELGDGNYSMKYNFNSPVSLDGSKNIQYQSNASHITLKEVRIYSTESEGGSSGTAYQINDIVWSNENVSTVSIDKLTFYYQDGSSAYIENVERNGGNNHWDVLKLGNLSKDNVVAVKFETGGTGTFKLIIQENGTWKYIWEENVTANQTYTFGTIPTTPETTAPSESPTPPTGVTANMEINENGELVIPNSRLGANVSIGIMKEWLDDEVYTFARPSKIKVNLYRAESLEEVAAKQGTPYEEITLNETNNWSYSKTLQRLKNPEDPNDNSIYYYYVEEINAPAGYTVTYENNDGESVKNGGIIHIENTLDTIDLNVKKSWITKDGNTPNSVQVKLQYSKDNGTTWTDIPYSTQTLTGSGWTYTYTGLPSNCIYRAVEVSVPAGWDADNNGRSNTSSTDGDTLTLTNTLQTAGLKVAKEWLGDKDSNRPENVTVLLYRKAVPKGAGGNGSASDLNTATRAISTTKSTDKNVYTDYSRLLQYSLYFYDANMCGDQVTENSALTWRNDCHPSDEIQGGFHDAGDHVMFGLPQGFTASTLGWSYYEFKDAYSELGLTGHYQTIMKHFCDFFVDSTRLNADGTVSEFLYQKGDGDLDHDFWGTPEEQDANSRKMYWTSNANGKASEIVAEYAASLALYSLNFPDDEDSENYLTYAKALYEFSKNNSISTYGPHSTKDPNGFYRSSNYDDDQGWAAGWLYLATEGDEDTTNAKREEYKNKCTGTNVNTGWVYCWNDVSLGAACLEGYITGNWDPINSYLSGQCTGTGYYMYDSNAQWGSARYNVATQLLALVVSNRTSSDYTSWCKTQMEYILGKNNANTCFVTGFADNSVKNPHHRAASGYTNGEYNNQSTFSSDGKTLIGALAGGPKTTDFSGYADSMLDYTQNEVALDYNAGLVGAAAGLYHFYKDDATVNTTFSLVTNTDDFGTKSGIETAYPTVVPTAQSLSLNAQQSQKANAIKGISMVGSGKVAKAYTEVYTITNPDTDVVIPLSLSNISKIVVEVDFNGVGGYNSQLIYNTHNGYFAITGSYHEFTLQGVSDIENVKVTTPSGWNGFEAKITAIRFYTESSDPVFTIFAAIPNNRTEAFLTDKVTLTPTNNAGNVTYTVKYADNTEETLTGNTFIPKKSGTVTITGNDGTTNSSPITITVLQPKLNAPTEITVGQIGEITVENLENYTVIFGDTELTETNGVYQFTAPDVTADTKYMISVLVNNNENEVVSQEITVKPFVFTITQNSVDVIEQGGTATLTANAPATWTIPENYSSNITLRPSTDGRSCTVEGKDYTADTITITATDDENNTDTAEIRMLMSNDLTLSFENDKDKIRVGETTILKPVPGNNVTFSFNPADCVEFNETQKTVKALKAGTVTINAQRGNASKQIQLTIYEPLTLSGRDKMNIGETQTLQVAGNIGNLTWTSDNEAAVTVDENGNVTAIDNGTATITVEDSDKATASITISVELTALLVDTTGLEQVGIITISKAQSDSGDTWTNNVAVDMNNNALNLANLPLVDAYGNKYEYYIVEQLDPSGDDTLKTSNAVYVPVSYDGNGLILNENDTNNTITVGNKLKSSVETTGQMPSAGGRGTDWYYIAGAAMMLAGLAGYFVLKRRQRSRAEA